MNTKEIRLLAFNVYSLLVAAKDKEIAKKCIEGHLKLYLGFDLPVKYE